MLALDLPLLAFHLHYNEAVSVGPVPQPVEHLGQSRIAGRIVDRLMELAVRFEASPSCRLQRPGSKSSDTVQRCRRRVLGGEAGGKWIELQPNRIKLAYLRRR